MIHISHIKARNFKSFKALNINIPKTFLCLAGPNGSGKSNFGDSIRFVLGEKSLKALRARKVRELIHTNAKSAEVTVKFDGETGLEVRRIIRDDGKIQYRMNGKRTTRSAILEALKKYNLDESGRNIIAQGEVQNILNMNGKERRAIIDSVAGISDFEAKKKEALRELETVEGRIKDANLVLGERRVFLEELGREKETALKYRDARNSVTSAKATLLRTEIERLEEEKEKISALDEKIEFHKKKREEELAEVDGSIAEIEKGRSEASEELRARQKVNNLVRKMEELKANVSAKEQLIDDNEGYLKTLREEVRRLKKEAEHEEKELASASKEYTELEGTLKKARKDGEAEGVTAKDEKLQRLRDSLKAARERISELRERNIALRSEISGAEELIRSKEEEAEGLSVKGDSRKKEDILAEVKGLNEKAAEITKQLEESFRKTKQINARIAEIDKKLLELKESASFYKLKASPALLHPALQLISDLKKKHEGIYGTVAELLAFDRKYAHAVEAAAGGRLLYVVVDDVDTATKIISILKKTKAGRATFIPLSKIKAGPTPPKGFGSIIEVLRFKEEIRKAVDYVFGDTILVESVQEAKKIGVGSQRMVTLDGEIFERSGVISGGRRGSSLLAANEMRKIESELSKEKREKESLVGELYAMREDETSLRSEKSKAEVDLKALEMELSMLEEEAKKSEELLTRKKKTEKSIEELRKRRDKAAAENEKNEKELSALVEKKNGIEKETAEEEKKLQNRLREESERKAEIAAKLSSLVATIDARKNEIGRRKRELLLKKEQAEGKGKEMKRLLEKINEVKRTLERERKEAAETEEKIAAMGKQTEKIFERMKVFETELQKLGEQRGRIRMALDRLSKDFNQLAVKKATNETRLNDIAAEYESYKDCKTLEDISRDELRKMISEGEALLNSLGDVNMAAIEMYEKKNKEIEEVEEKIQKLGEERKAVLSMISEIEEHKKEAFFETFYAVNENFSRLFKHLNIGEGHLALDKPNTPFESGLQIKIRRNNREHSLNSLSGGETTLVALMFIFAMQLFKPSPFYILDEVDAALDKQNSKNLVKLISSMSKDSQFIIISHNDMVMSGADTVLGVAKVGGVSKLVGVKISDKAVAKAA